MTTTDERTVMVNALTDSQVRQIIGQAEAGYPEEICGIVIGQRGVPATYQVRQVRNIANQERQRTPAASNGMPGRLTGWMTGRCCASSARLMRPAGRS
jgi:proteasome lid subunit RPN8/RPN11